MSGIYTELAKRRVEQSKEPVTQSSPPPLPAKPVMQQIPAKTAKPVNVQTSTPAPRSPALTDTEKVEKYTTHVEPSLVKKIQIEAIEKEINDYDVVRIALKEYFERNK
jgi:hypothetical protein